MVTLIRYRNSKLISKQNYEINVGEDKDIGLLGFIKQYYLSTMDIPKEIIIQEKVISQSDLNKWGSALGKRMPKIVVPKIGEKRRKLICALETPNYKSIELC